MKPNKKQSDEISHDLLLSIGRAWEDIKAGRYTEEVVNRKKTK